MCAFHQRYVVVVGHCWPAGLKKKGQGGGISAGIFLVGAGNSVDNTQNICTKCTVPRAQHRCRSLISAAANSASSARWWVYGCSRRRCVPRQGPKKNTLSELQQPLRVPDFRKAVQTGGEGSTWWTHLPQDKWATLANVSKGARPRHDLSLLLLFLCRVSLLRRV